MQIVFSSLQAIFLQQWLWIELLFHVEMYSIQKKLTRSLEICLKTYQTLYDICYTFAQNEIVNVDLSKT